MTDREPKPLPGEFIIAERKQKILDNSPLLAAFLGKVGTEKDNQYLLNKHMHEYDETFLQSLDSTWFDNASRPLVVQANRSMIFPPEASENNAAGIKNISKQLLFMGYELAPHSDLFEYFAREIARRMYATKAVHRELSYGYKLDAFIDLALKTGVTYADDLKRKTEEPSSDSLESTIFGDFINGLDLEGI